MKQKGLNMDNMVIDIHDVNKSFDMKNDKLHVLKDINLQVQRGEFVAILGPSGSGKSTLMNIVGCMDTADDGEYYLNGIPIHDKKEKELTEIRNKEIGFIFQKYHLIQTYNVMQNIVMPLVIRGMSYHDAAQECEDIVEMLGLSERKSHKPSELSGGQQQRVAIARALVGNPGVLLADEPTGALDSASGREVLKLFCRLNEMGNTIIMITHDTGVASYAERTVRIIDGRLINSK